MCQSDGNENKTAYRTRVNGKYCKAGSMAEANQVISLMHYQIKTTENSICTVELKREGEKGGDLNGHGL